ncbi:hypothetical protein [Streptomyces jumonjinensis]|uniref:hypothetical protein n=1 Tax=Streptomyces jumonjinensis TaxID=1945 RepID=UPI003794AD09
MTALNGPLLYARSRGLPGAIAAPPAIALLLAWSASRPDGGSWDPGFGLPMEAICPMLAAAVIGTSLYAYADELDRTAVRAWWPRRLTHLLALTALAATALALAAASGTTGTGASVMARNTVGTVGATAVSAVLVGARLSWLPVTAYLGTAFIAARTAGGAGATVWAWPVQPDRETAAWVTAAALFAAGAALHAYRGPRADHL